MNKRLEYYMLVYRQEVDGILKAAMTLSLSVVLLSSMARAEQLPLIEGGFGFGGLYQPYYPGSDETRSFAFPVPIILYRGDIVKADERGARAELIKDPRYELDISADFNLSVDSDDVEARAGMQDIGSVLQLGPSLEISLSRTDNSQWLLGLPLRANIEIDGGLESAGFTFAPTINYLRDWSIGGAKWVSNLSLAASFANRDYHELYYGVSGEFAMPNRPAYEAESGFSGLRGQLSFRSLNRKRLWVWFIRYDDVSDAVFEDSPLVRDSGGFSAGVIYSRLFWRSKTLINAR